MKAIILAAGFGSRLRPLTEQTHKSLLPVAGVPIMRRMIDNIIATGITEVAIVTGYRADDVRTFVANVYPTLNVTYIENAQYEVTNTGYSLLLCRTFAEGSPFVKFDADVVFESAVLQKLLNDSHDTCLCIDKNIRLESEEIKVICDTNDAVRSVGKKLSPQEACGESIGIEKIGVGAGALLFAELNLLMQDTKNHQEYYDDSYTTLVAQGVPFFAVDTTGLKWVEVDTHSDYQKAQEMFK